MRIYELMNLFIDNYQAIEIYSLDTGESLFTGTIEELEHEPLEELEIMSIDCITNNVLTVNVSTEEME